MQPRKMALAGSAFLALLLCPGRAAAQAAPADRSSETIDVTGARAVADAMDVIEKKYGVPIDYIDPQYAAPQDIESVSYSPGHVTLGARIRPISLSYTQVNRKPEERIPYLSCTIET